MSLFARLKQSFEDKKESYEAWAAMALFLTIATCFALVVGALGLALLLGPIGACAVLCGLFLLLAFGAWAVGHAKAKAAKQKIEEAEKTVASGVQAVTNTVGTLTSGIARSSRPLDAFLAGTLLLVLLYLGGKKASPVEY